LTLKDIYEVFIQAGMKADLRGPKLVQKYLLEKKKHYNKLDAASR
jgi:hypothetical protein